MNRPRGDRDVIAADGAVSCELPGGGRALFTSRASGNLSTLRGDGHEHGRAGARRAVRGARPRVAVREPPGPRHDGAARALARAGPAEQAVAIDADGHATALPRHRHDGAHRRLPARRAGVRGRGGDAPRRLARSRRGVLEEGVRALRRARRPRPRSSRSSGPARAPAAMRWAPRCTRPSATPTARAREHRPARDRARAAARGGCRGGARSRAVHDLRRALLLPPPRRRARGASGGSRMAELISRPAARSGSPRISSACARRSPRPPRDPPLLASGANAARSSCSPRPSTCPSRTCPLLADAGVRLVGENRAQDLQAKVAAHGELFEWDFIGQLQSRRVRLIVPHVRLIHSVASDSALRELERHRGLARPGPAHPDRGQRRGRGGQGGRRPRRARRVHRALARAGGGADDDAPALGRSRAAAAAGSRRCASWPTSGASSTCRWAPRRTTSSRSRRARQSCGSARSCMIRSPARRPRMTSISRETGSPGEDAPTPMAFRDSWHRALVYFGLAEEYHDDYEDAAVRGRDRGSLPRAAERPPAAPPPRRVRGHLRRGRQLGGRGGAGGGAAGARPPCSSRWAAAATATCACTW